MPERVKVVHVTTVPISLRFLRQQIPFMQERGYEIHAISSPGADLDEFASMHGASVDAVEMPRAITPWRDLGAVRGIVRALRRIRPDIVHAHTPKGGLLGMIAARIARVPVRVYHMRGLPMANATGLRRALLRASERVSCGLAHRVVCVGHSLRETALAEGLCAPDRIVVAAGGSGQGVDAAGRFDPATMPAGTRAATRARLGIPPDARVIGFVGRIVRDKGVVELEQAWRELSATRPDLHLVIVGPYEEQDPVPQDVRDRLERDARVHLTGMDWNTPPLYAAMDVVAMPTYREGFPNVPLEAAAMALPVVATDIPGCRDAIAAGMTGTLVPVGDGAALARALAGYLDDAALRARHGAAARARALRDFRPEVIFESIEREYRALLSARAVRRPGDRVKRALDVVGSASALLLLSPLLALLALAVLASMGRPVLFRQTRPGLGGEPFTIHKFRTMRDANGAHPGASDAAGDDDAARLTPVGRFLRATSLDELPELWDVLRGRMSLVGPRPLLMEYLPHYSAEQARRHDVRPGLTGWAQVNGRNALAWEDRFAHDVWYVDHRSLGLDLRILLRTIGLVLRRENVTQPGHATAERFDVAAR